MWSSPPPATTPIVVPPPTPRDREGLDPPCDQHAERSLPLASAQRLLVLLAELERPEPGPRLLSFFAHAPQTVAAPPSKSWIDKRTMGINNGAQQHPSRIWPGNRRGLRSGYVESRALASRHTEVTRRDELGRLPVTGRCGSGSRRSERARRADWSEHAAHGLPPLALDRRARATWT